MGAVVEELLIQHFEQGLRDLATRIRQELPAWQEAVRQLEQVAASEVLPLPAQVRALRDELESRAKQTSSLLAALEALPVRGDPRPPQPPTSVPSPERPPSWEALPPPPPGPAPAPAPRPGPAKQAPPEVKSPPQTPGARPVPVPQPPVDPRALERCLRAEQARKRGANEEAVAEYSAALLLAPGCQTAYLQRGRLHRLLGRPAEALDDFSAAITIAPHDVEAYRQRGQALAVAGELGQAERDFDRALDLDPGCSTTRFRRAVVYRLQGKLSEALADLTEVLRRTPDNALVYYNRGLIYLMSGDRERAIQDFTQATRLNPKFTEAHRKRQEACRARLPPPAPPVRHPLATASPGARAETLPERPLPGSTSRTERENCLRVACPACAALGDVRWDRLAHILTCKSCGRFFRVHQEGKLVEVKKAANGRWVERGGPRDSAAPSKLRRWSWRVVPVAVVAACLVLGFGTWRHRSAPRGEPELPRALDERAEVLARAWMKKDVPLMRRVTAPSHDRVLYSWFVRHQPPAGFAEAGALKDVLEVRVIEQKAHTAWVTIRVQGASQPELRLSWQERGGTWYFVPPAR